MMVEYKRCGALMIDCLSIVDTDKVNHNVEIDIVKLVVEMESFGMSADELDKETGSSDGLQPKQASLSCVHALNELHLHEIHVVPSTHEADQCGRLSAPERIALSARVSIERFNGRDWKLKICSNESERAIGRKDIQSKCFGSITANSDGNNELNPNRFVAAKMKTKAQTKLRLFSHPPV
nr:hypothetical protein [Tanacetum cinerariifolium]